jgi:hypothetical protein
MTCRTGKEYKSDRVVVGKGVADTLGPHIYRTCMQAYARHNQKSI